MTLRTIPVSSSSLDADVVDKPAMFVIPMDHTVPESGRRPPLPTPSRDAENEPPPVSVATWTRTTTIGRWMSGPPPEPPPLLAATSRRSTVDSWRLRCLRSHVKLTRTRSTAVIGRNVRGRAADAFSRFRGKCRRRHRPRLTDGWRQFPGFAATGQSLVHQWYVFSPMTFP